MLRYGLQLLLLVLLATSCAKHSDTQQKFEPITTFSGRLLVISPEKRFQVDVDWQGTSEKGKLRLTHGLSGRVVDVVWLGHSMRWRDSSQTQQWRDLPEKGLLDMGVLLPPWTLAKVFVRNMPRSMKAKGNNVWQGVWDAVPLKIKWLGGQRRVEISDMKHGRRAVVIFHE
jgi:hypothetical protein